jgi:DNA topoisomerase-2
MDDAYLIDTYKQRTHRDQILAAPDSYIGSIQSVEQPTWMVSQLPTLENPAPSICQETILYHPGLYKLIDEAIVNCRDQYIRMRHSTLPDKKMVSYIHVTVDPNGLITMENDGDGIDVAMHPELNKWIPEMIFMNLLTSTNYNQDEKRITGGKNGLGIKLVMIWSLYAKVETVDHRRHLRYVQEVRNNMADLSPPTVTKVAKTTKPYTKITFLPDYARLGMPEGLTPEMTRVFAKRTMDICGTTEWPGRKLTVSWNTVPVPIHSFSKYIQCFTVADMGSLKYDKSGDRWEFAVALSEDQSFHQISYVNGIATMRGGRHVDLIVNQIVEKMCAIAIKKKVATNNPRLPAAIRRNMSVFIRCDIENPSFDSQTKEFMTTPYKQFGSVCDISDGFVEKLLQLGFMDRIRQFNRTLEQKEEKKTDGSRKRTIDVEGLDDAIFAATAKSRDTILFISEGDSAKNGIKSGFMPQDKNYYGIYPICGKILNVLNATPAAIRQNEEIQAIKTILGLASDVEYTPENIPKLLRYGKVVLCADQDYDGSHIKGLLINVFETLWPSLCRSNFIFSMNTPILKTAYKSNTLSFYNEGEFQKWKATVNEEDMKKWTFKYYKGLGTSSRDEFREYIRNLKLVAFTQTESCRDLIQMVFQKSRVAERKKWMGDYDKTKYLDTSKPNVTYSEFINNELIHYSVYSCSRAISSLIDGLKTGQRKVICTELKRPQTSEIKVAQLAGRVSEKMDYHHGEVSLANTIIGQAQDFVGSNNIAYLQPLGQFGSRIKNGNDSASARYIFTKLDPITKCIFMDEDTPILTNLYDGNTPIEPEHYFPILPMVLINGSEGIGTGFSSFIPCFSPIDMVSAIRLRLRNGLTEANFRTYIPYYDQFTGPITPLTETTFLMRGIYTKSATESNVIVITELPVGTSTHTYTCIFLKKLIKDESNPIQEMSDNCTDLTVCIRLVFSSAEIISQLEAEVDGNGVSKLEKMLNLTSLIHLTNMYLFDENQRLSKYNSPDEIIDKYFRVRIDAYQRRRAFQLTQLEHQVRKSDSKIRYIHGVLSGQIDLRSKSDEEIDRMLIAKNLMKLDDSFQYLVEMPMNSVSTKKSSSLQIEHSRLQAEYNTLMEKTAEDLWEADLCQFEKMYIVYHQKRCRAYEDEAKSGKSKKQRK